MPPADPNPKGIVCLPGLTLTSNQSFSFIVHEWITHATTPCFALYSDQIDSGGNVIVVGGQDYQPVTLNRPADVTPIAAQCNPTNSAGPFGLLVATLGNSYCPGTLGTPANPPQMVTIQIFATAQPVASAGSWIRIYFSLSGGAPPPSGSFWACSAPIPVVGV